MEKKDSSNRPWKTEFVGIAKQICMSKYEILLLPLHAMAENFGIVRKSTTT